MLTSVLVAFLTVSAADHAGNHAGVGTYAVIIGTALYFALAAVVPISPVLLVLGSAVAATVVTPAVQVLVGLMTRQWKPNAESGDRALLTFAF